MRLTMLGKPGAGKGTQGGLLAKHYNIPHISTGAMFRSAIKSRTPMGKLAQTYIDRGHLVPDHVAIEVVKERLEMDDCRRGYILDGFPRTVPQATVLDEALSESDHALDAAVNIWITDSEAIVRIAHRRVCASCGETYYRRYLKERQTEACEQCGGKLIQRDDDTEETARERLSVYLDQTHPVVSYYEQHKRIITVDGEQEIEKVYEDLVESLHKFEVSPGSSEVL